MKLRKMAIAILTVLVTLFITSTLSEVKAAKADPGMYLKIVMPRSENGYGYKAFEKDIWKIVETNAQETTTDYSKTIYCLKGGVGFGSSTESGEPIARLYNQYFNMKTISLTDANTDDDMYIENVLPDPSSSTYKSLLWLLENIYVTPKNNTEDIKNAAEFKSILLENAGITDEYIEDDDIDAVQQLAIWHFTNNDVYKVENNNPNGEFSLHVSLEPSNTSSYKAMEDLGEWERMDDCVTLYKYLVNTATQMGPNYTIADSTTKPYKITNLTQTMTKTADKQNYIIGPFKIEKLTDAVSTFKGIFKNGKNEINPILQDANGSVVYNSLEATIGKEFYVKIPVTTEIENITLEIEGSYFDTTLTYWSVEGDPENPGELLKDQPAVVVERTKFGYSDNTTFTPEKEEIFDLALRKFIVSVNNVSTNPIREPQISAESLEKLAENDGITTAEKVHPKNTVIVKTGDTVIYKIRVYNEGNIAGYVKEITDYLPEGLELAKNSQINQENGWTNPSQDGKTILTEKLAQNLIPAFNGTTLEYLDVEIECVVTETDKDTIIKNIAEITKHSDSEGNTTITDRDSTPGNVDRQNYGETSQQDDDDFEQLIIPNKIFDLALRKFITSIDGNEVTETREPQISMQALNALRDRGTSTAEKIHPKNALTVKTGSKVIYTIRIYNEGEIAGYAKEITDYLPEGLKLAENSQINQENGWTNPSQDGKTIVTDKLAQNLITAFNGTTLAYLDVQIECEVTATYKETDTQLKNIAEITKHSDSEGNTTIVDIDSTPGNVDIPNYGETSQQDDDDFEMLIIPGKYFDLALRKFIIAVDDVAFSPDPGRYTREPIVDEKPLLNGQYTANYIHPKYAVSVQVGNIVTYVIRVYNEGEIDGYVHQITDHLPEYLEFINNDFNASYGWKVSSDGRTVTTNITSPNTELSASRDLIYEDRVEGEDKVLLKAFDGESLDYIDVQIRCKVKDTGISQKITNIAEITSFSDSEGNEVKDRDSKGNNVTLPEDTVLPDYKEKEINGGDEYIPGQQDDDDFEKVTIERFDLALRKFITSVNETEITNRIPVFSKNEKGEYTYTHTKTPVEVATGDIVVYTLRVFNEGNKSGYAEEIKDNLPEGLEYLPENELNKEYRWKMYKADGTETDNISEAEIIRTDYLSKKQEVNTGRDNLIDAFNTQTMTMPNYKDVKIAFKVTEPNTSDRIIINIAEISEDKDEEGKPVEDVDSDPDNDEETEDDIDIEKVKVKYFDLSLKKIITKVTMTLDGKTTVTETKHTFEEEPEPVVKIELGNHKIKTSVIKFTYKIRVTNEGEIDGYVKEIRDYIPEGLKFVAEDNKNWTLSEDGKTVTTDKLKDTLLQPGESADVEITLRWINGQNNLGLKKNIAEISEDYNKHDDTDDIDSTPDNKKEGEDDIDDASVVLSIVTGIGQNYGLIIAGVLAILITGVVLIKKFVL